MDTPIAEFVERYAAQGTARFHMPGHKGMPVLGCERLDITEIAGADALYEADGIIAQSEANAASLFGSQRTFYSTEGSSQCLKAMLYLALTGRPAGTPPVIVAARNVHRAFVHAAALLDFETVWLWPEERNSLCACPAAGGDSDCASDASGGGVYHQSGLSGRYGGHCGPGSGVPPPGNGFAGG